MQGYCDDVQEGFVLSLKQKNAEHSSVAVSVPVSVPMPPLSPKPRTRFGTIAAAAVVPARCTTPHRTAAALVRSRCTTWFCGAVLAQRCALNAVILCCSLT